MSNLTRNEILVLKHLADGEQHDEAPEDLSDAQFYVALKSLKEKNMVYAAFQTGGEVCSSQIKIEGRAALDDFMQTEMTELEFTILNVLRLNGREIDSNKIGNKQIYDFEELTLYTKGEITKASQDMRDKGWISIFDDGGIAYWHKLEDKGIIALREYLNEHPEKNRQSFSKEKKEEKESPVDAKLIEELTPLFYNTREEVVKYISKLRTITNNTEKSKFTANLVNDGIISDLSCKKPLWSVLHSHGLYLPTLNNWCKSINGFL